MRFDFIVLLLLCCQVYDRNIFGSQIQVISCLVCSVGQDIDAGAVQGDSVVLGIVIQQEKEGAVPIGTFRHFDMLFGAHNRGDTGFCT